MEPQDRLTQIRRLIGCNRTYSPDYTRQVCAVHYGRDIADRTWLRWRRRVREQADPKALGGYSEATHLLLVTLACLYRGNGERDALKTSQRVPLSRLCFVVEGIISGDRPWDLPELITYEDLRRLAELQAGREYTDRYHQQRRLLKSKPAYSKDEAAEILSNYPNFSYVQQQQAKDPRYERRAS